ncbi:nitrogen regulation protein NR(II) [Porticoccus sp. W117]|uniref:nitrogen regulation protein NR(II) n=1 Tax=Porticoccus sp. W117 TaxID=3054777 RepID=UPI002599FC84|nr:nitrogen regulation protein NR(II) [Porticoccus sp. W117]MDM3871455.1 nitrogen regulation protein NR(II) [Porticoccus sp. W117]
MTDTPQIPPLDQLHTAVLLLGEDMCILHANSAAENLLSIGRNQLQGMAFPPMLSIPSQALELQQIQQGETPYTYRAAKLSTPGDRRITVDVTTSPLPGKRLLLELQSVDRILQINREDALLSIQSASHELVLGLAHEVKNPLGGIKGAAQLLALELPVEQQEYTDLIVAEANRLSLLVDELLGPARPLQLAATNIHELTEHVAALITAELHSSKDATPAIAIRRDYDPSIPELEVDGQQLIQALLNIARNAAQALAANDGGTINLRSRIQRQFTIGKAFHRTVLRLDIEDDGPGIPEEIVDRIFYPMISGRQGGSGLGLHIAQTIIGRHSGLIECFSQPGRTRFSIFLPLQQEPHREH